MSITDSAREKLMEFVGKKVTVEVEDIYNTFHGDDIDHCGGKATYSGTLLEVLDDGIRISDFRGFARVAENFGIKRCEPVEGYIPFYIRTTHQLSETGIEIIRILFANMVIFTLCEN